MNTKGEGEMPVNEKGRMNGSMTKVYLVSAALAAACVLVLAIAPGVAKETAPPFPLETGRYWIYQGPTRWTAMNSSDVSERTMTWKMEVVRTMKRAGNEGALIEGHPADLAWYEPGKKPGEYLIVRRGSNRYYLLDGERKDSALVWFESGRGAVTFDDWDLFLQFPLELGKSFGGGKGGEAGYYNWSVGTCRRAFLAGVKGADTHTTLTEYILTMMTGPDDITTMFVPGVGITAYHYIHHGTVAETDLRLIEYGKRE